MSSILHTNEAHWKLSVEVVDELNSWAPPFYSQINLIINIFTYSPPTELPHAAASLCQLVCCTKCYGTEEYCLCVFCFLSMLPDSVLVHQANLYKQTPLIIRSKHSMMVPDCKPTNPLIRYIRIGFHQLCQAVRSYRSAEQDMMNLGNVKLDEVPDIGAFIKNKWKNHIKVKQTCA